MIDRFSAVSASEKARCPRFVIHGIRGDVLGRRVNAYRGVSMVQPAALDFQCMKGALAAGQAVVGHRRQTILGSKSLQPPPMKADEARLSATGWRCSRARDERSPRSALRQWRSVGSVGSSVSETGAPRPAADRRRRPCAPRQRLVHVSGFQHPQTADVLLGLQIRPVGDEYLTTGLRMLTTLAMPLGAGRHTRS